MIYRPVHELPDLKWKDAGEHISQTISNLSVDESILAVFHIKNSSRENICIHQQEWIDQANTNDRVRTMAHL